MEKKIFILITISLFLYSNTVKAQQRPHYTQYILNNYIINPALTGIENYTDIKLSTRNQWVGIDGAPRTIYLSAHSPLGKKDYHSTATSFSIPGENPRGKNYWEQYTASPSHHGVGGQLISYKTGYISRIYALATYAYHLGIGLKTNLAIGFGMGVSSINIDKSKIILAGSIDPAIASSSSNYTQSNPELNAGLWLYSSDFFVGLAAQQIIPQKLELTKKDYYRSTLVPHLFFTTGYRFLLTEDITALPSAQLRYIASMPLFTDINVKLQYRDLFWVGGNARFKEGFAAMAGVNVSNLFNVSYSYDANKSYYLLQSMQKGTHEIMLGIILGNKYGDLCPKNVW